MCFNVGKTISLLSNLEKMSLCWEDTTRLVHKKIMGNYTENSYSFLNMCYVKTEISVEEKYSKFLVKL